MCVCLIVSVSELGCNYLNIDAISNTEKVFNFFPYLISNFVLYVHLLAVSSMGLYIYDYEVAPGKTIYLRLAHHHDILHASFLVPAGSDNQHNDSPKPPLRASIIAYYKKAKC